METMTKLIVAQYSIRTWMQPPSLQKGSYAAMRWNLQCRDASQQETQQYYSCKQISDQFNPYAKFVATLFSAAAVFGGALIYAANIRKDLELARKDIEYAKILSKKDDEIVEAKTRADIEHRVLVYGYAEEYTRLQNMAGVYKDGDLAKQVNKKNLKKKAGVNAYGNEPIDEESLQRKSGN